MQARLAYEELVNPASRRQEGGLSHFGRAPHAPTRPGHSNETQTWSTGEHISHQTDDSFDFGLESSPRSQTSGTSSGFQRGVSTTRQSPGDDATADLKRRKNTEASGKLIVSRIEMVVDPIHSAIPHKKKGEDGAVGAEHDSTAAKGRWFRKGSR
jgi:hypothetical protein